MRSRSLSLASATLIALVLSAHAGDVIDRIVATVNGHLILQSDWDDEVRYEAFGGNYSVERVTVEQRKAALDRLIDHELLRQQMRAPDLQNPADDHAVNQRVDDIRKQYPGVQTDQEWQAVLARWQFTEKDIRDRIRQELDVLRLVDVRLRPAVTIDSKSIESYYNQQLLPELRRAGGKEVPLEEVTPKIRELLTAQKVNQLLVAWLQNLRAGSEIHTGGAPAAGGGGQVQ